MAGPIFQPPLYASIYLILTLILEVGHVTLRLHEYWLCALVTISASATPLMKWKDDHASFRVCRSSHRLRIITLYKPPVFGERGDMFL